MSARPTIAVIHATPNAMAPAAGAMSEAFPEAEVWNVLDDRLIKDANAAGGLTAQLAGRMGELIDYTIEHGAQGVLLSCSMYGPAAIAARTRHTEPILGSDEALFDAIAERRPHRVLLLGPLPTPVADSISRLRAYLQERDQLPELIGVDVPGAGPAAAANDTQTLADVLIAAARGHSEPADMIVLGMFSVAPARAAVEAALGVPTLAPPQMAAATLRDTLLTD
ncbi:aspartate/glutamate racemase family protein [Propionimicrobium sp. PCR01-08-3]|uniref:aspartate/glutamate racemase family protein n=1 Tax=Propionimicrobium sp. PCR01-08-3 TaxID=3052086 RepID=UPI00255CC6CB|nr:aspartate/glutamate racemase family protein [Propionimicrobium sp. PCR01-08-3]WIY81889.1 aspartate/glutamate racemase family protein [Propionimicrobium sp. PCR01-08-3]